MKQLMKRVMLCVVAFMLISTVVFASSDGGHDAKSEGVIQKVSIGILKAAKWFGYAIALGVLIWMGIKYAISPANEKATLKGKLPLYFIGVFAVVMALTLANAVANIAGNNKAGDVVSAGVQIGGLKVKK